jgi:mannose-6-phosphate isomerase-like protein (cupin superfamily)
MVGRLRREPVTMRAIHGRDITSDDSEDSLRAAILSATDEQEALNAFGVTVKPLIRAEQTGGTLSTYHLSMEPGIGSPFHVHRRDDETFYVLEGTFAFRHGDEIVTLGAGSNIFLPRNTTSETSGRDAASCLALVRRAVTSASSRTPAASPCRPTRRKRWQSCSGMGWSYCRSK